MEFSEETLRDLVFEESCVMEDGAELKVVDTEESAGKHDCTSIYVVFTRIFGDERKFFSFWYEQSYENGAYFYDSNCPEVEPYEETVTKYRKVT